jgi:hypothetical protein
MRKSWALSIWCFLGAGVMFGVHARAADGGAPATSQPVERPSDIPAAAPVLRPFGYTPAAKATEGLRSSGDFLPVPDRWRIGFPMDYRQNVRGGAGAALNPYEQNFLKGDFAIPGTQNLFLSLSATSDTLFEARRLPVASGVSTVRPGSFDFFGQGRQVLGSENLILSAELFSGDAGYEPKRWAIRATPVFSGIDLHTSEKSLVSPDVRHATDRADGWVGFQELFFEKRLDGFFKPSANFDFSSVRVGIQGFTSDFRGFLFSDNEPGIRLFGNFDNNRLQYNLAWFTQVEKDTNTGLNTFNLREQNVFLANVYRQDFIWPGYTAQVSFNANIDNSRALVDKNGNVERPAPVGTIQNKSVDAYYLGWAGDGHIGPVNVSHQFYQAFGRESFNPIAGRQVNINAQFASIEISYDRDYMRFRGSFAYASGDRNPTGGTASGFDSIFDNPNFAGGGYSFFTRQGLRLVDTGLALNNRNSFLPDLRTSKEQGQANFVNPGLLIYNIGFDADLTPKLKLITNASYLQFDSPRVLQLLQHDNKITRDIGLDLSVGLQYRPFLNNNVIVNVGAAALVPGRGFKEIYSSQTLYSVFTGVTFSY